MNTLKVAIVEFDSTKHDDLLNVAVEAALAASDIIMEALDKPHRTNYKGKYDLVTETDQNSEKIIKRIIKSNFSDHNILAEESGVENSNSDYTWIIDPLDGTTNFVHGYPSFSVSIGAYHKNEAIASAILEMPHRKLYSAIKDNGAWCEGEKIECSKTKNIDKSLLITGFGYERNALWELNMNLFKHFTDLSQGVRRFGSAAIDICHVASGKADGFWEFDLKPWDIAAGVLIAKESGCAISGTKGGEHNIYDGNIIVSNPKIHKTILREIKSYLN